MLTEACHILGAKKGELILELDFMHEDGVVPALENPPWLRIEQIRDYKYGKDMCPWVSVLKEEDPEMYDDLVGALSKAASSVVPSEPCFRVLYRNPNRNVSTITLSEFVSQHLLFLYSKLDLSILIHLLRSFSHPYFASLLPAFA
jgi:hypothetical protein